MPDQVPGSYLVVSKPSYLFAHPQERLHRITSKYVYLLTYKLYKCTTEQLYLL